jgi:hypothetical protein
MAGIANSGEPLPIPLEGAFVVSPAGAKRGAKTRSKTRSAAIPPDTHIAELEQTIRVLQTTNEVRESTITSFRNLNSQLASEKKAQAERIAQLEGERDRANLAAAKMREDARQIQAHRDKSLNRLDDDNRRLVKENADLAAQVETLSAQLEETGAGELEAQAARLALLERENADLRALVEQNARIAQEESEERQSILAENTELRGRVAELEEAGASAGADVDVDDLRRQLAAALKRVAHLEELNKFNDKLIREYQEEKDWQKRLRHNEELEPAHKMALLALREKTYGKGESYTRVYVEDLASEMGMKRQAAGRRLNELIEYGAFGAYRDKEKATVPDKRLGQREIEKERIHVVATALLDRVEDIKRTDGKQHGGYGNRCKKCGAENSLRHIYHTVCLACGHQDILMPDDAQAAILRAQAEAGIIEAETIVAQVEAAAPALAPAPALVAQVEEAAQGSDVHLEQQSQPAPRSDVMSLARAAGFPALVLADHDVKIAAGSAAWSHWTHMERPTNAQLSQVIAHFKGQPAPFDSPCDWCDSPETVWDPDGSGRRVTACFVYPERRKPQAWEVQAGPAHKTVDFASGGIVEVRG